MVSSPGEQQPLPRPEAGGGQACCTPRIPSAPPAEADGWSKGCSALAPETATRSEDWGGPWEDTRRGGDHELSEPGSPTPRRRTGLGRPVCRAARPRAGGEEGEQTQPDATHSHRRPHRAEPSTRRKPRKRPPRTEGGPCAAPRRGSGKGPVFTKARRARSRSGPASSGRCHCLYRPGRGTVCGALGPRCRRRHRPRATGVGVSLQEPHVCTDGHVLNQTQTRGGPQEAAPRARTPTCRGHQRPRRTPFCSASTEKAPRVGPCGGE